MKLESDDLAEKLAAAGKQAEGQARARREREVRGSHLLDQLLRRAQERGLLNTDKTGFHMLTGKAGKARRIYVAKKGGRVDLSGFTVQAPAVLQISEDDAKSKHLGKVRGQLDFEKDDASVLAAFDAALDELDVVEAAKVLAATDGGAAAGASDADADDAEAATA